MKRLVYVYDKNRESLEFLRGYFKGHKLYRPTFFTNIKELRKQTKKHLPAAFIVESPSCLKTFNPGTLANSVIATVGGRHVRRGLKTTVDHGVEHYLYAPYQPYDLDMKLQIVGKRAEYLEKLLQEKRDVEAISDFTYLLSSTLDPREVLFYIVKKLSEMIPVTRCSILSVESRDSRTAEVISTFEDPAMEHLSLDLKKYPEIRKAISSKKPVVIKDALAAPLLKPVQGVLKSLGIKSIIVVPIMFRREVIGTLFLRTSRKVRPFTEREVKLCLEIASVAANSLNNAFLHYQMESERAKLEKLAITDFLTGIYNIRYLYHRLEDEFSRALRYKSPLSCIMLDIDHFKRINDTYGHRTGDIVLREFAGIIKQHTRKSDVFARYGGEEFIMILPLTDSKGAQVEARRIKKVLREHRFSSLRPGTKITVSMGVAAYPNRKIRIQDDLISLADDALMDAKASGRNKVMVGK
jgi:two-component system cell cycle response regulator